MRSTVDQGDRRVLAQCHDEWNHRVLIVMPAKAGIHIHRPVFMDTGLRRYDIQAGSVIRLPLILL